MAISKKSFVNLDLQGNSLVNPTIGLNSNMTKEGSFQYNAAEFRLEYFNGTLVEQVANLTDIAAVTGGLIFQGGYDPTTNTPDITVDNGTVLKGFFWVATAAGTFLGETVQVGDSIIAKQNNPGTTAANWLILQGNVVIATDTVDGIVRLATQAEVNTGTEGGAVVLTPATFAASQQLADINTDINNLENDKLARDGSQAMTGNLDMGNYAITNVSYINTGGVNTDGIATDSLGANNQEAITISSNLNFGDSQKITDLATPTNGGDAANKTYVDGQVATALPLSGGTMSGGITMNNNGIYGASDVFATNLAADTLSTNAASEITLNANLDAHNAQTITNLPAPTNGGDATNKTYVDTAAATAESNANTYTDNAIAQEVTDRNAAIAAQSYSATIATGDWTLNAGVYEYTITHNLGSYVTFTAFYDGATADFNGSYAANTLTVYSNSLPSANTVVNVVKAGGNI